MILCSVFTASFALAGEVLPTPAENIDVRETYASASALLKKGDVDRAKDGLLKIIRADPDFAPAYRDLGMIAIQQNILETAIDNLRKAILLDPGEPSAHYYLATALVRYQEIEGAKKEYAKAAELRPNLSQAHQELGLLYFRTGELDKAIESFKKVLALNPNSPNTIVALGMAYIKSGKMENAIEQILELRRINEEAKARALEKMMATLKPETQAAQAPTPEPALEQATESAGVPATMSVTGKARIQGHARSKNPFANRH